MLPVQALFSSEQQLDGVVRTLYQELEGRTFASESAEQRARTLIKIESVRKLFITAEITPPERLMQLRTHLQTLQMQQLEQPPSAHPRLLAAERTPLALAPISILSLPQREEPPASLLDPRPAAASSRPQQSIASSSRLPAAYLLFSPSENPRDLDAPALINLLDKNVKPILTKALALKDLEQQYAALFQLEQDTAHVIAIVKEKNNQPTFPRHRCLLQDIQGALSSCAHALLKRKKGAQTPLPIAPASLPPSYSALPDEIQTRIMLFAGEAASRTLHVSRKFSERTAENAEELLIAWIQDPSIFPIVFPMIFNFLETRTIPEMCAEIRTLAKDKSKDTVEILVHMVRKCSERIEKEENRNLVLFYERLIRQIPAAKKAIVKAGRDIAIFKLAMSHTRPKMEGSVSERAAEIRKWMNQPVVRSGLSEMVALDLSHHRNLILLPREIRLFTQLESLDCSHNKLCALPQSIKALRYLQILQLNHNQLSMLPQEIGQLDDLRVLDLRHNQFSTLPQAIGELRYLRDLFLSNNQLTELPAAIGQLEKLAELNLNYNRLATLPPEFVNLRKLASLHLASNRFTTLPEQIPYLGNLIELDLRFNQLTVLPPEIGRLVKLRNLCLSHNQLTVLPPEIDRLIQLHKLFLSHNALTALPPSMRRLLRLESLYIEANALTALPAAMAELQQLRTLYLDRLTILPEAIEEMPGLEIVWR